VLPKYQLSSSTGFKSLPRDALDNLISDLHEKFDIVRDIINLRTARKIEPGVKELRKSIKKRLIEDIESGVHGLTELLSRRMKLHPDPFLLRNYLFVNRNKNKP